MPLGLRQIDKDIACSQKYFNKLLPVLFQRSAPLTMDKPVTHLTRVIYALPVKLKISKLWLVLLGIKNI